MEPMRWSPSPAVTCSRALHSLWLSLSSIRFSRVAPVVCIHPPQVGTRAHHHFSHHAHGLPKALLLSSQHRPRESWTLGGQGLRIRPWYVACGDPCSVTPRTWLRPPTPPRPQLVLSTSRGTSRGPHSRCHERSGLRPHHRNSRPSFREAGTIVRDDTNAVTSSHTTPTPGHPFCSFNTGEYNGVK